MEPVETLVGGSQRDGGGTGTHGRVVDGALGALTERVRPVALADAQVLPVLDPLQSLLPDGGLRRGALVDVGGPGATSLALALAAGASAAGSWVAAVGLASLGLVAAGELGVSLDRLALVPAPPTGSWAAVVAAAVDAVDVVLVRPGTRVRAGDGRRLVARTRERGAVVIRVGDATWTEGAEVSLAVTASEWMGLGGGHGHLRARWAEVTATGRRAAARPRVAPLWLPGADGAVAVAERASAPVVPLRGAG